MSYRFLKIHSVDFPYIEPFLRKHPTYKSLSYAELYDLFVKSCLGWNTNYTSALPSLGYETMDVLIEFEFLQKLWAKEHGIKYNPRNWHTDIVSAQLKAFQPDILFLDDLYYFDAPKRQFLRDAASKPVKIIGWRAAPTTHDEFFADIDLMLTCTRHFVDQLRDHGAEAELLLHAFEPSILDMLPAQQERDLDFTFVGNFVLRNGFHNERLELIKALLDATKLEVWGSISEPRVPTLQNRILGKITRDGRKLFQRIGISGNALAHLSTLNENYTGPQATALLQNHQGRFHDSVLGLEYFKILSRSKINLNKHIDCAGIHAGNIRLFEATGMGACLVTDWKENMPEMFEPDVEVLTYRSTEECAEKVRYLLDNQDQLQHIANAGQRRTLRDHTYQRRAEELDGLIHRLMTSTLNGKTAYSLS